MYQIARCSLGTLNPYFENWIYSVPYDSDAHRQLFDLYLQQQPLGWVTVGRTRQFQTRRARAALEKKNDSEYTKGISAGAREEFYYLIMFDHQLRNGTDAYWSKLIDEEFHDLT